MARRSRGASAPPGPWRAARCRAPAACAARERRRRPPRGRRARRPRRPGRAVPGAGRPPRAGSPGRARRRGGGGRPGAITGRSSPARRRPAARRTRRRRRAGRPARAARRAPQAVTSGPMPEGSPEADGDADRHGSRRRRDLELRDLELDDGLALQLLDVLLAVDLGLLVADLLADAVLHLVERRRLAGAPVVGLEDDPAGLGPHEPGVLAGREREGHPLQVDGHGALLHPAQVAARRRRRAPARPASPGRAKSSPAASRVEQRLAGGLHPGVLLRRARPAGTWRRMRRSFTCSSPANSAWCDW